MTADYTSISTFEFPKNTFVIGENSRLFKSTFPHVEYVPVSGRVEHLDNIPTFPSGSTIIIFSDAPSKSDNTALLMSVVHRLIATDRFKIIFISSVSALFYNDKTGKFAGAYSEKKNAAEQILEKSILAENLYIIRLGNAFFAGNWHDIAERSKILILPRGFNVCAASSAQDLKTAMQSALFGGSDHVINAWTPAIASGYFRKIAEFGILNHLYKNRIASIFIKLLSKLLWKFRIFVPSPADVDSFNPDFARQASHS